uniref:Transmembrane protein n=2 Tax=Caenorhabditis japonica TaxID=281687 RepID=A0A8R1DYN3_CAEJA
MCAHFRMSSTKTLTLIALLAVSALATPELRLKRALESETEDVEAFARFVDASGDADGSGEAATTVSHDGSGDGQGSGEEPETTVAVTASTEASTVPETTETPELATLVDEKPIEAATVVNADETASSGHVHEKSIDAEVKEAFSSSPSTFSFLSSFFALIGVYLIAM